MRAKWMWIVFAALACGATACGGGTGACVGSGGVLSSPVCKPDWTESECSDWNSQEVNGASWEYHGGSQCQDLGYTERCSDGSYRQPGKC